MANITQIEINGTDYDICDAVARDEITSIQDSLSSKFNTTIEDKYGNNLNEQPVGTTWWGNNFTNAPSTDYYTVARLSEFIQIAFLFTGSNTGPIFYLRSKINSIWQPWERFLGESYTQKVRYENLIDAFAYYYANNNGTYVQLNWCVDSTTRYVMQFNAITLRLDFYKWDNGNYILLKSFT